MSTSTLAQIKKKVRRLSASPSINQLTNADLEEYINTFMDQDFPSHLKIWNLNDTLDIYTVANEDQYSFDTTENFSISQPVYVDGYQATYTQSRDEFFRIYPKLITEYTGSSGDGSAGPYTFTISQVPFLKRQVTLSVIDSTGNTQSCHDVPDTLSNSTGTFLDNTSPATSTLSGTINYVTGAVSITWTNTIDASQSIKAKVSNYQASRPNGVMFFKDQITMRPVPDGVYRVTFNVYRKPIQLLDSAAGPEVQQWWQYIAFGAAIKILQDRQDMESIQNLIPFFKEQEALVLYRTATQMAEERTATIYSGVTGGFGGFNGLSR
jgi:hypothetical protein